MVGCPCADSSRAGAGFIVCVGFCVGYGGCGAGDADLFAGGFPVDTEGYVRVFGDVGAFLTVVVGVEFEAIFGDIFEENHAGAGVTVFVGGGEADGVGVVGF